jgi:proteasome maturation protein
VLFHYKRVSLKVNKKTLSISATIKKKNHQGNMEEQGIPIANGPFDHLRQGFTSFEQAHRDPHPIQILQNKSDFEWQLKLDTIRRTYGSHMAMRLATERQILSRPRRLPGLESSNIALSTMIGNDESIDFKDFLNGMFDSLPSSHC